MKPSEIAVALFVAGTAGQCWAAEESRLDLAYGHVAQVDKRSSPPGLPPAQPSAQMPTNARSCTVLVNTPNDVRRNRDTLGSTFRDNPIVSAQSPTIWLEAALLDLSRQGFSTVSADTPGTPGTARFATVSADLDKLYIWNHSLNLHATLVVRATIVGGGGETLKKSYRVNSTKLNWWNADGEFVDTINLAAGRLLEQMAVDIDGMCSTRRGA